MTKKRNALDRIMQMPLTDLSVRVEIRQGLYRTLPKADRDAWGSCDDPAIWEEDDADTSLRSDDAATDTDRDEQESDEENRHN
jgi:hypothetical protein